jgi:structural maintenance of chromosome 2
VQLNINNPNFLIMQGKITKVLNMKPAEILGMVEEAAGTRMFEERKEKAVKTMAKKDKKVEEIESVRGLHHSRCQSAKRELTSSFYERRSIPS